MKTKKEQLVIPANVDHLGELREFVTRIGKKYGYSERAINAFKLSIDEAATNIIKHAYKEKSGDITIRAVNFKNSMTFVLIDNGKYFDPRTFQDPDLNKYVDIGKKGGLGIFMMRRLLDKIDYKKTDNGNELWLTKNKEEKKSRNKISVSSIPVGLKARYWLISMAAFSIILILVYMFFFVNQSTVVRSRYIENAREACSIVGSDLSKNLVQDELINQEMIDQMITDGSQDPTILNNTYTSIQNLLDTQYSTILHNALVVDNIQNILATAEIDTFYNILDTYNIPADHKVIEDNVLQYNLKSGLQVVDVNWPVIDSQGRKLCTIHFFINHNIISSEIANVRFDYFNLALLVWIIGSAGLFLLIYLVMAPFKRLQDWVKDLGQPGAPEELDIDTSTEVGEIAKAFSDITLKLRDSQANLAEQERMQKEMQVAQEIQQTLLPSEFPKLEGYDLASFYAAAKEVGGDYYDFVEVDQDTLGIVVADVSGKGVPGSLVMTMIRTALRTEARGIKDAAQVLTRVNDFVVNDMKKGMFVTLFYVIIDSKRRRINFASAGHNPMILYRASQKKTYYLNPRGFPIGISLPDKDLFKNSLVSDTIALAKGDILVVYTDGVTEAMNTKRDLFGEERFLKVIQKKELNTAEEFVDDLKSEILSFTEGFPQNDDITLVAIKEQTTADILELDRAKQTFLAIQEGESVKRACKRLGISTYSYYHKYKEKFENEGVENFVIEGPEHEFEVKQLSIEEKTKIYDIIKQNPELGAKRISEELNTEQYEYTQLSPSKIYDELVSSRLNTKKLRENFMAKSHRKKRIKPPGTPMMTIDGKIIVDKPKYVREPEPAPEIKIEREPEKTPVFEKAPEPEIVIPDGPKGPVSDSTELVKDGPVSDTSVQDVLSFEDMTDFTMPDNWLTDIEQDPSVSGNEDEIFATEKVVDEAEELDLDELEENESTGEESVLESGLMDELTDDMVSELTAIDADEKEVDDETGPEESAKDIVSDVIVPESENIVDTEEIETGPVQEQLSDEIVAELSTVEKQDSEQEIIHQVEEPEDSGDTEGPPVLPEIKINTIDESDIDSKEPVDLYDPFENDAKEETTVAGPFEDIQEIEETDHDQAVLDDSVLDAGSIDDDLFMDSLEHDVATLDEEQYSPADIVDEPESPHDSGPPAHLEASEANLNEIEPKEEEPDVTDLGVEGKHKISDVEQEERELLDMLESRKSYIDEPGDKPSVLHFDDSEIEEAQVISESSPPQPFDEFAEQAASSVEGKEQEPELIDEEFDFSIALDDIWNIKEMNPETTAAGRPPISSEEPEKLSFEDLINLAGSHPEDQPESSIPESKPPQLQPEPDVQLEKSKLFRDKLLNQAIRLYERENYTEAIQVLQELKENYSQDLKVHGYLGNAYFHSKQYHLAAQEYEKVLNINANNIQACENLGVVYANQGNLSKAIVQWERLLAISPGRQDIKKSIEQAKKYLNKMI